MFLVTSEDGTLPESTPALEDSTELIRQNIESLGFRLEDVKVLLQMQAHWDHTAALAEIKEITGAEMWATADDARVLEDGGFSDPHFGGEQSFTPVEVDRILAEGDVLELGAARLTVVEMPGHTEGSSGYAMTVHEAGRDYRVIIANMGTINAGKQLVVDPTYAGVADDFAATYQKQKALDIDIWVAAHGSQYNLHDKWGPGNPYESEHLRRSGGIPPRRRTPGAGLPGSDRNGTRGPLSSKDGITAVRRAPSPIPPAPSRRSRPLP